MPIRRWEVDTTLIHDWIIGLDEATQDSVLSALEYLADNAPPRVDRSWTASTTHGTRT